MRSRYDVDTRPLLLPPVAVQPQRLVVPPQVVMRITSWREACRLAWKLRRTRITQRTFAELTGCYPSHVSDYFSVHAHRRELPAAHAGAACLVLASGRRVVIDKVLPDEICCRFEKPRRGERRPDAKPHDWDLTLVRHFVHRHTQLVPVQEPAL